MGTGQLPGATYRAIGKVCMNGCVQGDGVGLKVDFVGFWVGSRGCEPSPGRKGAVPVNTQGCKPFTSQKGGATPWVKIHFVS